MGRFPGRHEPGGFGRRRGRTQAGLGRRVCRALLSSRAHGNVFGVCGHRGRWTRMKMHVRRLNSFGVQAFHDWIVQGNPEGAPKYLLENAEYSEEIGGEFEIDS